MSSHARPVATLGARASAPAPWFPCSQAKGGRGRPRSGKRTRQTACKPGSVPGKPGGRPFVWDARCRTPRATNPGDGAKTCLAAARPVAPIRSCSRWGLPCRPRRRGRGALLPHPFTLAAGASLPRRRSALCGTFPGVAPAGRYPAPCLRGARTFLPPARGRKAAVRPSDASSIWARRAAVTRGAGRRHGPKRSCRCQVGRSTAPQ